VDEAINFAMQEIKEFASGEVGKLLANSSCSPGSVDVNAAAAPTTNSENTSTVPGEEEDTKAVDGKDSTEIDVSTCTQESPLVQKLAAQSLSLGEEKEASSEQQVVNSDLSEASPPQEVHIWNTDLPPYIHVQTVGHVAGIDEHIEMGPLEGTEFEITAEEKTMIAQSRDPKLWGVNNQNVHCVNIHPEFGGWYAYRMCMVFPGVTLPGVNGGADNNVFQMPAPKQFLTAEERRDILVEFNLRPDVCRWRDLPERIVEDMGAEKRAKIRYTPQAFLYFHEKNSYKRERFMELCL